MQRRIVRARAPLRLGLAGGGTDVSPYCDTFGGAILNFTIDKYAFASVYPAVNKIQFVASDFEIQEDYSIGAEIPKGSLLQLHRGVYNRIINDFCGGRQVPLRMVTHVDAPIGSGLGSSSALVVTMVMALCDYLKIPLGEYDIARLAYSIEREDLGLAGGKQDQYAATFGGVNFMEFYEDNRVVVNPLRIRTAIQSEIESSLLLVFTGKSRQSASVIEAQSEAVNAGGKSLDAMHQLKIEANEMKDAFLFGDFEKMSAVLARGWEAKKKTSSAVTTPEVDQLFDVALSNGAKAGKLSGAGGGGFAMFFVNPDKKPQLIKKIIENGFGTPSSCNLVNSGGITWECPTR